MNVGLEVVSTVVLSGELKLLLDSGFNLTWLSTQPSSVVFTGNDKAAYSWILSYHQRHHVVPSLSIFREQFPESTYRLQKEYIPLSQLTELILDRVSSYQVADLITKVIEQHDKGNTKAAVNLIRKSAGKLSENVIRSSGYDITSPDFDIELMLNTELKMGIPFGIEPIDQAFWGFQPGQLITLLGRQKSSKTINTLNSALHAWKEGYKVLFFSVEMGEILLQQRLLALGSHVSMRRIYRGTLTLTEKDKVRKFQAELSASADSSFVISRKRSMVTLDDIYEAADNFHPDVVYIDGYSFMIDRKTGKMTDDWQANENVAAELKALAMERNIVVFVNTQVQEKQYTAKNGIEARSIAGGTGLLKASDLVIGLDKDKEVLTLSFQLTRFEDMEPVNVEVDFDTMTFSVVQLNNLEAKGV